MLRAVVFALFAFACFARAGVLSSGGCNNAIFVPGPYNGQVVFGDTSNSTTYDNVCDLDSDSGTFFFTISPDAYAPLSITTCLAGTTFNTVLAVYQGEGCDSLECVVSNDDSTCSDADNASSVQFTPTGGSYWVMVSGNGSSEGQFEISFKQESATESRCESAIAIQGPFTTPVSVFGTMLGNTTHSSQPCHLASTGLGNWYIIYPTPGAVVTVTTCGDYSDFDTELAVLVGDDCSDLNCVSFSDDSCDISYMHLLSTVTFTADSAFYYVYVTGHLDDTGSYYLTISEEVTWPSGPGVNCANAYRLPKNGQLNGFTNVGSEPINGTACGHRRINDCPATWFVLSPDIGVRVTFSTCESSTNFNTVALYLTDCRLDSCKAENNDDTNCRYTQHASSVTTQVSTGADMYFVVYGVNCQLGNFGVQISSDYE